MKSLSSPKWPTLGKPVSKPVLPVDSGPIANPVTPRTLFGASKFLSVPIADIAYSGSYRELDENHVLDLQASIGRIGLTTPISLAAGTSKLVLIAGQHRLEAARRLGWAHINAITFDSNKADNRLVAISENLHRLELCPLDRAELLIEWLQAIRDQAGQVAHPAGGQQPNDRGISEASRQTGVSAKQIRRAEAIVGISPEAKATARELGLHAKQSALLKIAEGKTAGEQLKIASKIVKQKKRRPQSAKDEAAEIDTGSSELVLATPSSPSTNDVEGIPDFLNRRDPGKAFQDLVAAWNAASQLKLTWADAPSVARSRFAVEVLCILPAEQSEANYVL
ncbi:ParB/RepB/Spo0J family partition protein [Bradyrhizobium sp. 956_D2_N1_5]|uniref:ParB/RepB/Spo0J family partition protein n=1 Tax=unclassified Bradyrhizobium TaxID=2631580 RepID=UPI003F2185B8